jgi:predicted DNA-binding transcriptional regulator YafY
MRRTDRLFDLIQILRDGRLHRAADMAVRLKVSVRTVWRDVATLAASGLPVEGERGVGYILRAPITLPPMMLSAVELEALRLGLALAAEAPDAATARAARALARRIAAVTPAPAKDPDGLFAFTGPPENRAPKHLPVLRRAIKAQERVSITYLDARGLESHRDICPLGLEKHSRISTLAAWCEARGDFRSFRADRIMAVVQTGERFAKDPARSLGAYRARMGVEPFSEQGQA